MPSGTKPSGLTAFSGAIDRDNDLLLIWDDSASILKSLPFGIIGPPEWILIDEQSLSSPGKSITFTGIDAHSSPFFKVSGIYYPEASACTPAFIINGLESSNYTYITSSVTAIGMSVVSSTSASNVLFGPSTSSYEQAFVEILIGGETTPDTDYFTMSWLFSPLAPDYHKGAGRAAPGGHAHLTSLTIKTVSPFANNMLVGTKFRLYKWYDTP